MCIFSPPGGQWAGPLSASHLHSANAKDRNGKSPQEGVKEKQVCSYCNVDIDYGVFQNYKLPNEAISSPSLAVSLPLVWIKEVNRPNTLLP